MKKKRDLTKQPLDQAELDRIRHLLTVTRLQPIIVAEQFGLQVQQVLALRSARRWSRAQRLHDVGNGREMTVSQIAEITGLTRVAIHNRLSKGVVGAGLLAYKHTLARKRKGLAGELGHRLEKRRGAPAQKVTVRPSDLGDTLVLEDGE